MKLHNKTLFIPSITQERRRKGGEKILFSMFGSPPPSLSFLRSCSLFSTDRGKGSVVSISKYPESSLSLMLKDIAGEEDRVLVVDMEYEKEEIEEGLQHVRSTELHTIHSHSSLLSLLGSVEVSSTDLLIINRISSFTRTSTKEKRGKEMDEKITAIQSLLGRGRDRNIKIVLLNEYCVFKGIEGVEHSPLSDRAIKRISTITVNLREGDYVE